MSTTPRYPHITVPMEQPVERDNAMAILARTRRAMLDAGVPREEIADFVDEATSDDYDHVIDTVRATVTTV